MIRSGGPAEIGGARMSQMPPAGASAVLRISLTHNDRLSFMTEEFAPLLRRQFRFYHTETKA
jgi:hypothetical protein